MHYPNIFIVVVCPTIGVATFILENNSYSTADARPLPHTAYDSTIVKIEILQGVVSLSSTICALSNLMAFFMLEALDGYQSSNGNTHTLD